MKKIKYLTIALISILFVTGCGKKITCTYTEDGDDGEKWTEKIVMKEKDDKLVYIEAITEIAMPKNISDSEWKEFVEMTKEEDINTDGYEGIEISQEANDSKRVFTYSMKADLTKVNDKAKEELDEFIDAKVDDLIKEYEEDGYKCNK